MCGFFLRAFALKHTLGHTKPEVHHKRVQKTSHRHTLRRPAARRSSAKTCISSSRGCHAGRTQASVAPSRAATCRTARPPPRRAAAPRLRRDPQSVASPGPPGSGSRSSPGGSARNRGTPRNIRHWEIVGELLLETLAARLDSFEHIPCTM